MNVDLVAGYFNLNLVGSEELDVESNLELFGGVVDLKYSDYQRDRDKTSRTIRPPELLECYRDQLPIEYLLLSFRTEQTVSLDTVTTSDRTISQG